MKVELNIQSIRNWIGEVDKPLIISGPCSAETEEQLVTTAQQLVTHNNVHLLRAGLWKPRTRPNSFEGIGDIGLTWLKTAGEEIGVPVVTEVANAQHVEKCLKAGIDALWIGARTTVNPFSVQEIADALKGVDIPVFVKNPVNPDLQLWIGALERIHQAGITKLAAIHRGFSSYNPARYRNPPNWGIPVELKTLCPELDIICDPSHIGGRRDLLLPLAQKAFDLDMDGLMIETHMTPDAALSDAQQQVTPEELASILRQITFRTQQSPSPEFENNLEELRTIIDLIDKDLLEKLAERMKVVEKIGEYKRLNGVTVLQIERWKEIIRTRLLRGNSLQLTEDFVMELLRQIHKESITRQDHIMNQDNTTQPLIRTDET